MKLSGQMVLKNRQRVSVTGLRNRQGVSITDLRKRQSVSVTGLINRQSVSVTQISSSLALLRRLDCLFLKPVTETHCLFFSTIWPDNFIKISWFRGEGGQKRNFCSGRVFISYNWKFYQCDRVPLRWSLTQNTRVLFPNCWVFLVRPPLT